MTTRIRTAMQMLRANGIIPTARYAAGRFIENRYERRFGIQTGDVIQLEALGIANTDSLEYSPIPYRAFFNAMRHVPEASGVFVDYGSGMGRVLVCAATFPFKRITGVELSEALIKRARENLAKAKRLECTHIEIIHCDAARWRVPADVTVFHFYNPFRKETLSTVIADIARSLRESPRKAWIVYAPAGSSHAGLANPWSMERLMHAGELIPRSWVKGQVDEPWPFSNFRPGDPNGNRYRVYTLDARVM